MDVLVAFLALVGVIGFKVLLFVFFYAKASKKTPKKKIEYEVVQRGAAPAEGAKRVLVTGGCGFLGSSIVRQLHERFGDKLDLVVLDTAIHARFGPLLPAVTYVRADACTYTHVHTATHGCAAVIHTAGIVGDCTTRAETFFTVNEQGTRNVVEACLERDVGALIYTSSGSVVFSLSAAKPQGGGGNPEPVPESSPALPPNDLNGPYARSKAAAERLVLAANSHVLHTVVLRPGGVYGRHDPNILSTVLKGLPYIGPGYVRIPFVWVEDAARAHVLALERLVFASPPGAPRINGRAFHLAHDPRDDPFLYKEFGGSELFERPPGSVSPAVKAAEEAAGVHGQPPEGVNAYGMRPNGAVPYVVLRNLAQLDFFCGQRFGFAVMDRALTPQAMLYATNHWQLDVGEAKRLLGWEPTPFRVVAAAMGADAAAASPAAAARYVGWGAAAAGAKGKGKAKAA